MSKSIRGGVRGALAAAGLAGALGGALWGQGQSGEIRRVHGVVVNDVTNRPVGRALVSSADQRMAVLADSEGRFDFEVRVAAAAGVGAGSGGPGIASINGFAGFGNGSSVILTARKPGYHVKQGSVMVSLTDAEVLRAGVQIRLVPEAIVMGRVSAPGADVPAGVQVQLMQKQVEDGRGVWRQAQSVVSDALGEYRIADLLPGEYKVRTAEWMEPGRTPVAGQQQVGYPPMTYPAGESLERGAPLRVAAGQTVEADLLLQAVPYYPVEVPVRASDAGVPGVQVTVNGAEAGASFALTYNRRTQSVEGSLPNGRYHLVLSSYGRVVQVAELELVVADKAVTLPPVTLVPAAAVRVEVREDYTAATQGQRQATAPTDRPVDVYLQPEGGQNRGGIGLNRSGGGQGNEAMVIEGVRPGSYRVMATAHRGYVAEIQANGLDLLHQPLVVDAGMALPPIEITLRDDVATVSGTVSGADLTTSGTSGGMAGYVRCVPAGDGGPERIALSGFASDGKFTISNLPPGRYVVFAMSGQPTEFAYRDEETLKQLKAKGAMVTVAGGQQASVTAPMIVMETPLR